jgi:FAD/FMN-containing dehydrogenase
MTTALLQTLRSAVGDAQVLTHEDPATDLSAWETDWRGRSHGRALAVVRPGNTAEVAAVVKACVAVGASLVPQGGNTGLVVGSVPDDSGTQVLLSLTRMNAVRALDTANLTLTVEAGCVLQAATSQPTRAAPRCCATAMRATCVWAWKWSPRKATSGTG